MGTVNDNQTTPTTTSSDAAPPNSSTQDTPSEQESSVQESFIQESFIQETDDELRGNTGRTPRRILITGSMRSGKSRYAAQLGRHFGGEQVTYVAMLAAGDGDMLWRLDGHRAHHPASWETLEHHIRPSDALKKAKHDVVIIDSLTGWVANVLLEHEASGAAAARDAVTRETDHFIEVLQASNHTVIMATNEVGAGVLPSNHLGMWTREALGQTNQRIAALCDDVALVIMGIPQVLKGNLLEVDPLS